MSQREAVLTALQEGEQLTAKQIAARYRIANPYEVVRVLRNDGYPIYLNETVNSKGDRKNKYRLGTPTRRMVSAGIRAINSGVDSML